MHQFCQEGFFSGEGGGGFARRRRRPGGGGGCGPRVAPFRNPPPAPHKGTLRSNETQDCGAERGANVPNAPKRRGGGGWRERRGRRRRRVPSPFSSPPHRPRRRDPLSDGPPYRIRPPAARGVPPLPPSTRGPGAPSPLPCGTSQEVGRRLSEGPLGAVGGPDTADEGGGGTGGEGRGRGATGLSTDETPKSRPALPFLSVHKHPCQYVRAFDADLFPPTRAQVPPPP